MNSLKIIGLFVANKFKDATKFVEDLFAGVTESLVHTMRVLYLAIGLTVVGLFTGVAIAASGQVAVGRGVIIASGFVAILLFTLFNTRALAAAYAAMLASRAGHALKDKIPELSQSTTDSVLKWVRGITLWIMLASFYAMSLPVWENIGGFVIALSCGVLIATMSSAWDMSGAMFRWVAKCGVLGILVWSTLQFVAPETSAKIRSSVGYLTNRLNETGYRTAKLGEVEHQAKVMDATQDAALLAKIRKQQADIRLKALNDSKCMGLICDKADEETYAKLETAAGVVLARMPKATEPEAPKAGGVANLAPPKAPPIANPANKTPVVEVKKPAAAKVLSLNEKDIDEAFAGLDE